MATPAIKPQHNKNDTAKPEQLKELDMFKGDWKAVAEHLEGSGHPGEKAQGLASYNFLPGDFFMIGRWDRAFTSGPRKGISVIGCNENGGFFMHSYDNLGLMRQYGLTRDGKVWTINGEQERAKIDFTLDGNGYTEIWEVKKDGAWVPLCRMKVMRNK